MGQKRFTIGITPGGNYSNTKIYKLLARVYDPVTNCSYISKKSLNVGHPVTDDEWWQKDTSDARESLVQHTETSVIINPHCLNQWPNPVPSLSLTLLNGQAGLENEYQLEFTVDGDEFFLNLSQPVRWMEEPEFIAGYTYQVSILNGLAVCAGWEAAEEE